MSSIASALTAFGLGVALLIYSAERQGQVLWLAGWGLLIAGGLGFLLALSIALIRAPG